jgi:hypothetical protein
MLLLVSLLLSHSTCSEFLLRGLYILKAFQLIIIIIIIIKSLLAEKTVVKYFTHTHTHTWYKNQFSHYLPTSTVEVSIVYNKPSSFSVFKAAKFVRRKFVNKLYSDWVGRI